MHPLTTAETVALRGFIINDLRFLPPYLIISAVSGPELLLASYFALASNTDLALCARFW